MGLDALHYKVMDEKNRVVSRAIYNVLGIDKDGHKDLLGMYVSKSEDESFWLCPRNSKKTVLLASTSIISPYFDPSPLGSDRKKKVWG